MKLYFNQYWPRCTMQWLNSLWPSDTIWRQKSESTLAQVMACCLTAPSHYLNQCWLTITKVQWCSSEGNFASDHSHQSLKLAWKLFFRRFYWNLPGANELTCHNEFTFLCCIIFKKNIKMICICYHLLFLIPHGRWGSVDQLVFHFPGGGGALLHWRW